MASHDATWQSNGRGSTRHEGARHGRGERHVTAKARHVKENEKNWQSKAAHTRGPEQKDESACDRQGGRGAWRPTRATYHVSLACEVSQVLQGWALKAHGSINQSMSEGDRYLKGDFLSIGVHGPVDGEASFGRHLCCVIHSRTRM